MSVDGKKPGRLGILVGGGPAPGINGVIAGATTEALRDGLEVVGFRDGFKWLSEGDGTHQIALTADLVEQSRLKGGSILGTSRVNPTRDPAKLANVVRALQEQGISYLVTIGGDDTAFSASRTAATAAGHIRVAHVPKTIDNDLPLPNNMPTFGYNTARAVGSSLVRNLVEDARTTSRWYIVVAMGRSAGHLALGIGTVAGAALTIIPEEFAEGACSLDGLCDAIEGAALKSSLAGRNYGVVVIAEGVGELIKDELAKNPVVEVTHDEHGHIRLAEVPLAIILKREMQARAKARGEKVTYVDCTIGYELRCADPVPSDAEYVQQLGWGAVRYLRQTGDEGWGDSGSMISIQAGEIVPIPFDDILDPVTCKTAVRRVNVHAHPYRCARAAMLRLERADLEDDARAAALAAVGKLTMEAFRAKYSRLVGA